MPANNRQKKAVSAKKTLLKLDSSKQTSLDSSKRVDEVVYYSLADVETVIQAVLSEMASDPTVGVTLSESENGVTLNCVNESGDEYEVEVELENEDGDVLDEGADVEDIDTDVDVTSNRRMNSARTSRKK